MFATLPAAVGTMLAALCLLVFAAVAVQALRLGLLAQGIAKRVRGSPTEELAERLARAPDDVARLLAAVSTLPALLERAGSACSSLAESWSSLSSQAALVRETFRLIRG